MKKTLCSILFMPLFFLVQVTFGDTVFSTITVTDDPQIPIIKGRAAKKLQEIPIAGFNYTLNGGEISSASIEGQWGGKNIGQISKLDLYFNDTLLIDFGQYYKGLNRSEKKALVRSLRHGGMIPFNISIDQDGFADLGDGQAHVDLVGKPRLFRNLHLGDITVRIVDSVPDNPLLLPITPTIPEDVTPGIIAQIPDEGSGPQSPEPASILLLGSGLIGLAGYGRKKFFKK